MSRTVSVCALLLGIWLVGHPWQGIWHDAVFYAFLAIADLDPRAYRSDLFVLFGSQGDYTLFSSVYARGIHAQGLRAATLGLLLVADVLWIGAAAWLLRRLLSGFPYWLALLLVFAMPRGYGGYADQVRYAEPFLTPRLLAEGLSLLSLALLLRGRNLAAVAAVAAAFAMHPLMAIASAGFASLYGVMERPRLGLVLSGLCLGLLGALAAFAIAPFDRLLVTMDDQWFALSLARSPFVFWDGWRTEEWLNRVLLAFGLLATASVAATGQTQRVFLSALLLGGAALLATWLGTSVWHNVLLIQIQPWRALWLVQLFSWIAAAWLAGNYWQRGHGYRLCLLGFLVASLTLDHVGGAIALLAAGLFVWQPRRGRQIGPTRVVHASTAVLLLLATVSWFAAAKLAAALAAVRANPSDESLLYAVAWVEGLLAGGGSGTIALALFLVLWRYVGDHRLLLRLGVAAGVLLLLLLAAVFWYRPTRQQLDFERWAFNDTMPSLTRRIPVGAVVYWANDPTAAWFALGRANYASRLQTAGIVFSRQTAFEGKRRMDRLAALGQKDGVFAWFGDGADLPKPSVEGLLHVCHDPALDYVILATDLGVAGVERYVDAAAAQRRILYDCSVLRRNHADPWPGTDRPPSGGRPMVGSL